MGKTDVWQGTLALMVLKTLETMGPQHGYGIARRIEQTSGDLLSLNYGTLYPALLKIEQEGFVTRFTLEQAGTMLPIVYTGDEPLPDTFKDGAQAVCDGELATSGTFEAKKIQAKCASKYEAGYDPATLEPSES